MVLSRKNYLKIVIHHFAHTSRTKRQLNTIKHYSKKLETSFESQKTDSSFKTLKKIKIQEFDSKNSKSGIQTRRFYFHFSSSIAREQS